MGGLDRRGAVIAEWQRVKHRLRALDAELADLRLSEGEVNALAALAEGPRTARALADATAQHPSTLTGVLDRSNGGVSWRAGPTRPTAVRR
jgi:DNA-binding MarR family transcriptional regulator